MKKILKNILPILIILLITILGLIAYFIMLSPNHSIIINSFDGQSSIYFGEYDGVDLEEVKTAITFEVTDAQKFADEVFLTHENFEYTAEDNNYKYYIFNKDGYYYYAFLGNSIIYIKNLMSSIELYDFPFFSACLTIDIFSSNVYQSTYTWEEIDEIRYIPLVEKRYTSYEDVKEFYLKVNPTYWTFDDATKTIQLTGYQNFGSSLFGETRISDDYFITLVCDDNGITVTYHNPAHEA